MSWQRSDESSPSDDHMRLLLTAAEITRLRTMEKLVNPAWRDQLLDKVGPSSRHRIKLLDLDTGPTRGSLQVYARRGARDDDFSTGLVLFDLDDHPLVLLRVNGPHPGPHVNRWPVRTTLPVRPHVHYLTERYLAAHRTTGRSPAPDGYALLTTAYRDLPGAIEALARRAHIAPAKAHQLVLGEPWPYVRALP